MEISEEAARAAVLIAPLCRPTDAIAVLERGCAIGERYAKPGAFSVALIPIAELAADLERLGRRDQAKLLRRLPRSARPDQRAYVVASCDDVEVRLMRATGPA